MADPHLRRVTVPSLPLTGGCQCKAVRYLVKTAPLTFYLCHCKECQRQTSSAFGESLRVKSRTFEVDGAVCRITWVADSGALREGWFCPACGVRLWHGATGSEEINIKAGTLDDTSWLVPAGHIWAGSRQAFINPAAGELVYLAQPDDGYAELQARWRLMMSDG